MLNFELALASLPESERDEFVQRWNNPEERKNIIDEFEKFYNDFEKVKAILDRTKQALQ